MIVSSLIVKISSMFLIMCFGFLLVKTKILKSESSSVLSKLSIYLIIPCATLAAYQVDYSPEILKGMLLALAVAVVLHALLLFMSWGLGRIFHMSPVEKVSIAYSNAGNLIYPLVTAIFGPEWIIYSTAFNTVQRFLLWSHGKGSLCGEKKMDWKKVLLNINLICCFIGLALYVLNIRFPAVIAGAISSTGDMIGPAAMLVTGMLIGGMDIKQVLSFRRVWLIAFLRLLFVPAVLIVLTRISGLEHLVENGEIILLISCMATMTPSASTVTQMSQVYGSDANYASAINVVTTALCILTMPLMVALYQAL